MSEERNDLLEALQERIAYRFKDPQLLERALVHSSYAQEHDLKDESGRRADNERLEFLGDGVLKAVTSHYLFERHPLDDEGDLSKRRRHLVNGRQLTRAAVRWGLDEEGLIRAGPSRKNERLSAAMLEDAFEALIGAIYLDRGYDALRLVLEPWMAHTDSEEVIRSCRDPKTELQERLQDQGIVPPAYEIVDISGPAHALTFEAVVRIAGKERGRGRGGRKKDAEKAAATQALALLDEGLSSPDLES